MTVLADGGGPSLRGLIGTAFADGEPALPALDDVLAEIELLGAGLKRRQRVRTGVAAAVLCVSGFGMVSGITYIVRSHTVSTITTVPVNGGNGAVNPSEEPPTTASTP